jgi:methylmalonyl-CoA mutase N-terminal domain/subunit
MSEKKKTTSDIEIPISINPIGNNSVEKAGEYPFTRGIYPNMYRGKHWTMRQYAGFGTAFETNKRFKYLLEQGQTGLSVAFDLATQIGYDSDHPMAKGEVGRTGVAIDSLADMETLFDKIPLDKVSTSMTINSTAVILLAMYIAVGKKQNVSPELLMGTIQNDILKEFIARGTYIFPTQPSMRIITDIFEYTQEALPKFNSISISGYHIREAGATAAQEVAFTLSNGIAYVEAACNVGLDVNDFAPRLSFFFASHNNLFEEVAKFRVARKFWAKIMKDRFNATNPKAMLLRFHTQTGGSTLTAQQPENNIVRTAMQALAAVLGGTQSLHTNAFDEALGLPTEKSAEIALRTQQILSNETGIADTVDPLAGSYYVEYLMNELETKIGSLLKEIDDKGGSVSCIDTGFYRDEIARSAYEYQKNIESNKITIVGVNKYSSDETEIPKILKIDQKLEQEQVNRLKELKAKRDTSIVIQLLETIKKTAETNENIVEPIINAVEQYVTVGEISQALREVWGEYHENNI